MDLEGPAVLAFRVLVTPAHGRGVGEQPKEYGASPHRIRFRGGRMERGRGLTWRNNGTSGRATGYFWRGTALIPHSSRRTRTPVDRRKGKKAREREARKAARAAAPTGSAAGRVPGGTTSEADAAVGDRADSPVTTTERRDEAEDTDAAERVEIAEMMYKAAAQRAAAVEAREKAAAERDSLANARDRAATDRDSIANARDRAAVERDSIAHPRPAAGRAGVAEEGEDAALERARLEAELQRAHLDALTGAFRREVGRLALRNEIERARRADGKFVIAFIDVDGLKGVNDRDGHAAGDRVLRTLAATMRANLRSYDPIVRFGGDEFILGISSIDPERGPAPHRRDGSVPAACHRRRDHGRAGLAHLEREPRRAHRAGGRRPDRSQAAPRRVDGASAARSTHRPVRVRRGASRTPGQRHPSLDRERGG